MDLGEDVARVRQGRRGWLGGVDRVLVEAQLLQKPFVKRALDTDGAGRPRGEELGIDECRGLAADRAQRARIDLEVASVLEYEVAEPFLRQRAVTDSLEERVSEDRGIRFVDV